MNLKGSKTEKDLLAAFAGESPDDDCQLNQLPGQCGLIGTPEPEDRPDLSCRGKIPPLLHEKPPGS